MQDSPGGVPQVSRDMRRRESAESLPVTPPCDTHSVTGAATILHADLDAFYAAVEVRINRPCGAVPSPSVAA